MMKVDAFGKRVADAQQIDEFRQRVAPQNAVLFEVHHQPAVVDDEGFENPRIVVLRQTAEIRVAAEIVEQIGADRAADDIGA